MVPLIRRACLTLLLIVVASVTAGFTGVSRAAAASPAPAPARLVVDAGAAGGFIAGHPIPVRVKIDSDVLVAGQLVISTGSFQLSRPVEIPGGSSQGFEMVVPTPIGLPSLGLQVSLMTHGTRLVSTTATLNAVGDSEMVGILPELLVGQPVPGSAPLSVDAGTARFVAVSEQDLALAPASLGPLSTLAAGPDDLGRLSPDVRQAVLTWTEGGGRLLIDAAPTDAIVGLPAAWKPLAGGRAAAGRGEIVMTSGAMAAGHWAGVVDPAAHGAGANPTSFSGEPLSISLASTAGLSRPKLRWLIAFLLVYIAVVGPLSFLILRRRRRAELLWVVIPVVALLFAGTSYTVGSSQRAGLRLVHGTIVDTTTSGGGTAVSYIGVSSPGESTARLQAPAGWVLSRYDDPSGATFSGQSSFDAAVVDRGIEGRYRLAAGQFAIFQASGPARLPGQLVVNAHSEADGHAQGSVTNATPYALHDVSVLIGGAGTDIGALAPGAQATWQIDGDPPSGFGFTVEQQLWGPAATDQKFFGPFPVTTEPGPAGGAAPGPVDRSSPANLAVWSAGPDGLAPGSRGTGLAVAVGWTDQYRPGVAVAGRGVPSKGATAIVGTSPVETTGPVGDFAVVRRVVRGALSQVGPGMFVNTSSSDPTLVAFIVPAAGAGHSLTLTVPAGTGGVDVWSGKAWRRVADGGGGGNIKGFIGPSGPFQTVPLPGVATTAVPPGAGSVPVTIGPLLVPGPIAPPTIALPGGFGPATSGPSMSVTLDPGDASNGTVYVRLAAVGQPVDLSLLSLKVAP